MLSRHRLRPIALAAIVLIAFTAPSTQASAQEDGASSAFADCRPITDPDAEWTMDLTDAHAGWRFVNSFYRTCTQVRTFLERLTARTAPEEPITTDDMYEATLEVLAPRPLGERLGAYVERARESVRAVFSGEEGVQSATVDDVYYEGVFDRTNSGVGVSISREGISRGEFRNGQLSGDGQTLSPDGAMAAGQFRVNTLEGDGARRTNDGVEIAGTFDNGRPVGYTEHTYPDGSRQRVLYDDDGRELARGARVGAGLFAEDPEDPRQRAAAAAPLTESCETERRIALATIFGETPTEQQGQTLESQLAANGLNGDVATLQQGWRDFSTARSANVQQAAGNAYSRCRFQERLAQVAPDTDFQALLNEAQEDATDRLFASLPTRDGASTGADMLRDSTDPEYRAAREAERRQRAAQMQAERAARQARNNAFWDTVFQAAAIGVQVYADYTTQQLAAEAAAQQQAAVLAQQQAQQAARQRQQQQQQASTPYPQQQPSSTYGAGREHNPANDASQCMQAVDVNERISRLVNQCGFSVEVVWCSEGNPDSSFACPRRGMWTWGSGGGPSFRRGGGIHFAACRGPNSIIAPPGGPPFNFSCPDYLQSQ